MNAQKKITFLIILIVVGIVTAPAFAHKTYSYTPSGIWVPQCHAHSEVPHENPGPLEGASKLAGSVLNVLGGLLGG